VRRVLTRVLNYSDSAALVQWQATPVAHAKPGCARSVMLAKQVYSDDAIATNTAYFAKLRTSHTFPPHTMAFPNSHIMRKYAEIRISLHIYCIYCICTAHLCVFHDFRDVFRTREWICRIRRLRSAHISTIPGYFLHTFKETFQL